VRRFRRSRWAAYFHEDAVVVDIRALLSGELAARPATNVIAASALTGAEAAVSPNELALVSALQTDEWTTADDLGDDAEVAERLTERGLVVADDEDGPFAELRARDERLTNEHWDRYAALFHFMDRGRSDGGVTVEEAERAAPQASAAIASFVAQHGPPPDAFHRRRSDGSYALEHEDRAGTLYDALRMRRTARAFAADAVSFAEVSAVLRYTFGCHGYWRTADAVTLHKTAPSGGGLHPVEAYAIVLAVEGVPTGAYHYNVERNDLDLLKELDAANARSALAHAACGQQFVGEAAVVVLLTGRFFRSFWKYRDDARAYAVLLMDVGHLSQTFQLVATDLGLASFVTAAIDGPAADALVGVDGTGESVLAFCGCGRPSRTTSPLDADVLPYFPKRPQN
jgi:putative peptide maturation dehydrogenase